MIRSPHFRSGATLVEVLMSLLIMSIGIVSVFTLFPVSILSSIKATQLTNAKLLESNVIELLRTAPQLVEGYAPWKQGTSYATGDYVALPPQAGRVLSSSNLVFKCTTGGTSGYNTPNWPTIGGGSVTDGSATWTAWRIADLTSASPATIRQKSVYIVDPLGYWRIGTQGALTTASQSSRFGSDSSGVNPYGSALVRHHANLNNLQALNYFALGDSWSLVTESIPVAVTATSVEFPSTVDVSSVTSNFFRVVIRDANQTKSAVRIPATTTPVSGQTVNLGGANLPTDIVSSPGVARIETFAPRYTFLLTVTRQSNGTAQIQVPVFFNRAFNPLDERVFGAEISGDQITVDMSGTTLIPTITEGNYVFDARNGIWYRIAAVGISGTTATVTIDRTASFSTSAAVDYDGGVMFPPGIVRVFNIEL